MIPVSIIVPLRNEANFVRRCLESILQQSYPGMSEVLIVDGMSDDGTQEIVRDFILRDPRLRLYNNEGRIVSKGLNIGVSASKGEIIFRIDGHCTVSSDYVERCVEYLTKRNDVECVGGPIVSIGDGTVGKTISLAMSSQFGVGNAYFRYFNQEAIVDTVAFGAYRRRVFDKIGLFDEELVRNQDDEFNYRLRESGGKILLVPGIRAEYHTRSSLGKLWRQYFEYGYWKVRVMQKHPKQMQPRQFVPPTFVAALLISMVSSLFTPIGIWMLGLVGGSYAIANLLASVYVVQTNSWKSLPLLPIAYAALHLSYGSGFLVGLAKFWNRWADRGTHHVSNAATAESIRPTHEPTSP